MKKLLFSAIVSIALIGTSTGVFAQSTIAGWTFENSGTAINLNPTPSTNASAGSVSASCIGMVGAFASGNGTNAADITQGVTADTGTNGVADTTQVWRLRGQGGVNVNGWSSGAAIGTQGAQFNVDTTGFNNISISFDWYSTKKGEANMQLQYTTNGSTWINTPLTLAGSDGGLTLVNNTSGSLGANYVTGYYVHGNANSGGQMWFTDLSASISDVNAANDSNFGIRIVNATTGAADVDMTGGALNNTSGNWRLDNVVIAGQSVPEPGSFAMLASGLLVIAGGLGFRRSRQA